MVTLHARRRRAEHDGRALLLPAHHREVAGVVTRCLLLLVRVLVFLIDDHETKRLHRGKHRRARADHNPRTALPDLVPLVVPFPRRQVTVQHRHQSLLRPLAEPRLEPLHRLRRKRDFRYQHDRALPLAKRVGDRLQVHLRLAAAGHAVQQKNIVPNRLGLVVVPLGQALHRVHDRLECGRLLRVQLQRLRRQYVLLRVRVALGDLRRDAHQPLVLELANGRRGRPSQAHQFLQRQLAPLLHNRPEILLSLGQLGRFAVLRQCADVQPFAPAFLLLAHSVRQHRLHSDLRRAAVVVGDPAHEAQNRRRHQCLTADRLDDLAEIAVRRLVEHRRHHPHYLARPERHLHPRALVDAALQLLRHEVVKLTSDSDVQCHTGNHSMATQLEPR